MKKINKKIYILAFAFILSINIFIPTVHADNDLLTITGDNFVADTFKGVDAIYRPGGSDGSNQTYSCAAFIKKFYKEVYNVSVYNLFAGQNPKCYGGEKIIKVSDPQVGDIVYSNSHWSIVKRENDNETVTLIEQNWKWSQDGKTVTKTNRTVDSDSVQFFRLDSEN